MKASFYYEGHYIKIAKKIKSYLNSISIDMSDQATDSVRAVGDMIESLIAEKFDTFLGKWCVEYSNEFGRREMADLAFVDKEGFYTLVDVKTHRIDTDFNMPNLTSAARLAKLYEEDKNIFCVLMVKYTVKDNAKLIVKNVDFSPIEFLDWECLTIGALGWGQIQIANSNYIKIVHGYSRKKWILRFCDTMSEFYSKEISKTKDRTKRFHKIKEDWEAKKDIWS